MFIYAGIDEAGYGPFFGPMTVGRCVLGDPEARPRRHPAGPVGPAEQGGVPHAHRPQGPGGGQRLEEAQDQGRGDQAPRTGLPRVRVAGGDRSRRCRALAGRDGRDHAPVAVGDAVVHRRPGRAWAALPCAADPGELAIARGLLGNTARRIGVDVLDLGTAVVFEDRFNRMVAATRSKAAVNFTFVAGHLQHVWQHHAADRPTVVVDRQSGRMRYRDLLAMNFPEQEVAVVRETPEHSAYLIETAPTTRRPRP